MIQKNIVLIGFMGTGKTTVGKILSKKLKWTFVDTDYYIEKKTRVSIKRIFETYGEQYFRSLEKEAIDDIFSSTNLVISTGGGVILNYENVEKLKVNGKIYLLHGNFETIIYNLENSRKKRPLLLKDNWKNKARELIKKRKDLYNLSADYIISIDNKSLDDIVEEILSIHSNI